MGCQKGRNWTQIVHNGFVFVLLTSQILLPVFVTNVPSNFLQLRGPVTARGRKFLHDLMTARRFTGCL
jgi:hypothetical protein